jgi:Zn-dependent protease with chaperone function
MRITAGRPRMSARLVAWCLAAVTVGAQTVITLPKNKYTPKQDVELGKEAAAEVRKQYPIIRDERIASYLSTLGDRLVAASPRELKQPVYEYSFTPVNLKEINAFALPGGPMFVHRGMFDAAASEAEVIGVMAHELSHVLLRHGTANMTKASNPWLQLGQMAGIVGGAVVGGAAGSAIAQGSQLGLGSLVLKYSREFEKQADLMGAQIMARAGYDPRALAHMFETIEKDTKTSGGGSPEWLSDHPNPGNRTQYITKEATMVTVAPSADTGEFQSIKAAFNAMGPAKTMKDVAKGRAGSTDGPTVSVGTPGQPVPAPSTQYKTISGGKVFQASVPNNWTSMNSENTVRVVPQNGYGELNGETVFSHGVEFGVAKAASGNLRDATSAWLKGIAQSNPDLQVSGEQERIHLSNRAALSTPLVNASPLGGKERIGVYTTFVANGILFYYVTVVPEKDAAAFQEAFRKVGESIRFINTP